MCTMHVSVVHGIVAAESKTGLATFTGIRSQRCMQSVELRPVILEGAGFSRLWMMIISSSSSSSSSNNVINY